MDKTFLRVKIMFVMMILSLIVIIVGGQYYYNLEEDIIVKKINNIDPYSRFNDIYNLLHLKYSYYKYQVDYENHVQETIQGDHYPSVEGNNTQVTYAKSIPVLVYHGIKYKGSTEIDGDGYSLTAEAFRDQMFALKSAGWQTISKSDFEAFMRGEKQLPEKSFLLTFDDGRKDSFYGADPILKAVGYNAIMFVITGESLDPNKQNYKFYLNINELQTMLDSGRWELEAHTAHGHGYPVISINGETGHFYSDRLWIAEKNRLETKEEHRNRVYEDLKIVKEDLERTFGINVTTFAYPFGDYGKDSVNYPDSEKVMISLVNQWYNFGFYQTWVGQGYTYNYPFIKEPALTKRLGPSGNWSGAQLLHYLEFGMEKQLPYDTDDDYGFQGFVDNEGSLLDSKGTLTILTGKQGTNAFSFLDGTYLWRNYRFNVEIKEYEAVTFSLMARISTPADYVSCTYSQQQVQIIKSINGVSTKMAEKKLSPLLYKKNLKVGMEVDGNKVSCLIDNKVVIDSKLKNNELANGGIGVGIWNPSLDGFIRLERITVD